MPSIQPRTHLGQRVKPVSAMLVTILLSFISYEIFYDRRLDSYSAVGIGINWPLVQLVVSSMMLVD